MKYGHAGRDLLLELKRGQDDVVDGGNSSIVSSVTPLPAYNEILVQACVNDLCGHAEALDDQVRAAQNRRDSSSNNSDNDKLPMSMRPSILLHTSSIQRNKRCLLAYHVHRLNRIQDMVWNHEEEQLNGGGASSSHGGGSSSNNNNTNDHPSSLSPLEQEFALEYEALVSNYSNSMNDLLLHDDDDGDNGPADAVVITDLRSNHVFPPLQPHDHVLVRVERDDMFRGKPVVLESGMSVLFQKGTIHYLPYNDVETYLIQGVLQLLDGEETNTTM